MKSVRRKALPQFTRSLKGVETLAAILCHMANKASSASFTSSVVTFARRVRQRGTENQRLVEKKSHREQVPLMFVEDDWLICADSFFADLIRNNRVQTAAIKLYADDLRSSQIESDKR